MAAGTRGQGESGLGMAVFAEGFKSLLIDPPAQIQPGGTQAAPLPNQFLFLNVVGVLMRLLLFQAGGVVGLVDVEESAGGVEGCEGAG